MTTLRNEPESPRRDTTEEICLLQCQLGQAKQQISVFNAVATILRDSRNLNAILQGVAGELAKGLGFNAVRIFVHDRRRDRLLLRASFSAQAADWSGVRSFQRGQGNVGRVAETREALVFEDIQKDAAYETTSRTKKSRKGGYRFFGAFPIESRLQTAGVIVCIGSEPRRLQPGERQLITAIANQLGVALENAGLIADARAKADEFSALYSISTTINESLDVDVVLRKVMYRIMEIFGADAARVYLLDETGSDLQLVESEGLPPEFPLSDRYKLGEGVTGKVFESGTPLFFGDTLTSRNFARISQMRLGLRKVYRKQFYIPISVKNKTLGVMNFLTKAPRPFNSTETHLIRTIANHLGMAFENLNLFRRAERQARELSSLVEINRDIARLLDRNTLLPKIAEQAKTVLGVDITHFRLLEDGRLVSRGSSHQMAGRFPHALKLGESLSGVVAKEKTIIAVRDGSGDPRLSETHRRLYLSMGWRSYLGIPMIVGGRVTGVLCFLSKEERVFSPQEIQIAASFADSAAIAVENAKLFAEVLEKVEALEALNRELHIANRIKSEFLGAVSHELRTPLTAIVGYAGLLRDGYGGDVSETQHELLESMQHNSEMLLGLINNVLTLASIDARKVPVEISQRGLQGMLHHLCLYTTHLIHRPDLEVLWKVDETLPQLVTDHMKLEQVLQNLIYNAYKFTLEGRITIGVRNLQEQGRVEFSVSDTGIGIEDVNKVFDRFYQGPHARLGNERGMGLGLSIVKEFVDLIEGELHVESQPGTGSTFSFTIPYAVGNR